MKLEIGNVYHNERFLVNIDFNLEDLYWLQSLVPCSDTFQNDLQKGIDWIEHNKELLEADGTGDVNKPASNAIVE